MGDNQKEYASSYSMVSDAGERHDMKLERKTGVRWGWRLCRSQVGWLAGTRIVAV